ncbi:MAG TPA: dethiobiotin synthase [Amycolatopsis sp.]|uniref:dethiobiotin synthase n=1 Tax=Amycolatopsis sp. TaxID=37632 RepID=UPI002B480294|nr:dethiobiotin synthase [Amycolatopsis sp.]HKS49006.1 dethiobiotin synthase [Amycolatopsis sp.]
MLVVTGTGTGVGKTVVAAAIAALARTGGRRVAVLKPAQTGVAPGEPGDLEDIVRLAGEVTTRELRRYPDPLSPEAAARRSGIAQVGPAEAARAATQLDERHDLVLIEGAGGLLVPFGPDGTSLVDIAWALGALVLVVAEAGLGTLNTTALTAEVATSRGLHVAGVVIGSWPREPGLAALSNVRDLPVAAGAPLLGALAEGMGALDRDAFLEQARRGLSPWFGGEFDAERFEKEAAAQT